MYSWKKGTSLHFEWCEKCEANNEIFKCVLFNNVNGFYCLIAQSLRLLSSIFKYAKWSWCKRACTCSWAHSHVRIHPIICSKLIFFGTDCIYTDTFLTSLASHAYLLCYWSLKSFEIDYTIYSTWTLTSLPSLHNAHSHITQPIQGKRMMNRITLNFGVIFDWQIEKQCILLSVWIWIWNTN